MPMIAPFGSPAVSEDRRPPAHPDAAPVTLADAEREHILTALREAHWVLGSPNGAAHRLGMKRSTLAGLLDFIAGKNGAKSIHTRRRINATICRPSTTPQRCAGSPGTPFRASAPWTTNRPRSRPRASVRQSESGRGGGSGQRASSSRRVSGTGLACKSTCSVAKSGGSGGGLPDNSR